MLQYTIPKDDSVKRSEWMREMAKAIENAWKPYARRQREEKKIEGNDNKSEEWQRMHSMYSDPFFYPIRSVGRWFFFLLRFYPFFFFFFFGYNSLTPFITIQ